MQREEQRFVSSNIKISINVIIAMLVTVAFLLLQFFVLDDVMAKARDLTYWLNKAMSGLATFTIMISLANTTEESRKKRDREFNDKLKSLDSHYTQVFEHGEIDNLEIYVQNVNVATKYNVFIKKIKAKIKVVQKLVRNEKRRKELTTELEKKLLLTPEEVWENEKVKFNKITVDQLFSGIYDIEKSDKENDLHLHRGKYGLQKLGWKIMSIVAFGFMTADLVYHFNNFTNAMIVPLLIKIITILLAAYSGICFGYFMMDKVKSVLRKKLRILSKFRVRQDAPGLVKDLTVAVLVDNYVTKAMEKYREEKKEEKVEEKPKEERQTVLQPPNLPEEVSQVVMPPIPQVELPMVQQPVEVVQQAIEQPQEQVVQVVEEQPKETSNPFKQTYEETFGAGKPVKIGKFGVQLVTNMLKYNPNSQD